jgi:predicted dinucleotide-binding enzyme
VREEIGNLADAAVGDETLAVHDDHSRGREMHRAVRIGARSLRKMLIGILGTGTLATALARGWRTAGHELLVAGRSREKAERLAGAVGGRAAAPRELETADAVLLAVAWEGVEPTLEAARFGDGVPLIDPTNAVEHGVGELLPPAGESAAGRIAALAPGARVVKAFHLFPAERWTHGTNPPERPVVAICGDDARALDTVAGLVRPRNRSTDFGLLCVRAVPRAGRGEQPLSLSAVSGGRVGAMPAARVAVPALRGSRVGRR